MLLEIFINNKLNQHDYELKTFFAWEQTFQRKEDKFLKQLFPFSTEQRIIWNMWVLPQWKSHFFLMQF